MSIEEFSHLLSIIHKENSWGLDMYENIHEKHRPAVKYVEAIFDSRYGDIYLIKLKQVVGLNNNGQDLTFDVSDEKGKEKLYCFLSGTKTSEEIYEVMRNLK